MQVQGALDRVDGADERHLRRMPTVFWVLIESKPVRAHTICGTGISSPLSIPHSISLRPLPPAIAGVRGPLYTMLLISEISRPSLTWRGFN